MQSFGNYMVRGAYPTGILTSSWVTYGLRKNAQTQLKRVQDSANKMVEKAHQQTAILKDFIESHEVEIAAKRKIYVLGGEAAPDSPTQAIQNAWNIRQNIMNKRKKPASRADDIGETLHPRLKNLVVNNKETRKILSQAENNRCSLVKSWKLENSGGFVDFYSDRKQEYRAILWDKSGAVIIPKKCIQGIPDDILASGKSGLFLANSEATVSVIDNGLYHLTIASDYQPMALARLPLFAALLSFGYALIFTIKSFSKTTSLINPFTTIWGSSILSMVVITYEMIQSNRLETDAIICYEKASLDSIKEYTNQVHIISNHRVKLAEMVAAANSFTTTQTVTSNVHSMRDR